MKFGLNKKVETCSIVWCKMYLDSLICVAWLTSVTDGQTYRIAFSNSAL